MPAESMVKVYCPKCCDVYTPKSSRHHHIDGVYFGTGFPHMLFMVHPELRPPKPTNLFVPRCVTSCLQTCGCFCISSSISVIASLSCVYISLCLFCPFLSVCFSFCLCACHVCLSLSHTHTHTHTHLRLYGFKIHPLAYQLQQQAAAKSRSSKPRSQKQTFK